MEGPRGCAGPLTMLRLAFCLLAPAAAQLSGSRREIGPPLSINECTVRKCKKTLTKVTLDANWRWLHEAKGRKACFTTTNDWDPDLCPDPDACASNCALEGISEKEYHNSYGIVPVAHGIQLKYMSRTKHSDNFGSRVFVMDGADAYHQFHLKNREFAVDVDISKLPCGMNGAVYFVEMDREGGRGTGNNQAGARYGTGYCDAQCPQDLKFVAGAANLQDWDNSVGVPMGHYGSCCAEMDIFEANSMATSMTAHPCGFDGQATCEGDACGPKGRVPRRPKKLGKGKKKGKKVKKDVNSAALCDHIGCDYSPFRFGEEDYFGPGNNYTIDTTQPFTVVTQFLTSDGTDDGELVEVRRYYLQAGEVIENVNATLLGDDAGNSITPDFCKAEKIWYNEVNRFAKNGGLKKIGEAFDRGMVLVLGLWDDPLDNMQWLDAAFPPEHPAWPGATRGPCPGGDSSTPDYLRNEVLDASVSFSNIAFGEIGSVLKTGRRLSDDNYV